MNITQQIVNAIWLGGVYSLFALGYALVFSVLGVLNLAHSAVFMWGAFIGLVAVTQLNVSVWAAIPLAMVVSGIISIVLDVVAFAPLRRRNAPRISQLISSIGAAILLVNIAQLIFGTQPQRFPLGSIPSDPLEGLPVRITPIQIIILLVAVTLMAVLQYLVVRTRAGQAMRAVAFNQRVASLLGINSGNVFRMTFFLAGALAGAAGVLFGLAYNTITPFMGDSVALKGLTVIVLGGLGNIQGAVVGGFVVAALEVFSIAAGGSNYREAFVFTLLFLILLFRPQGLVGQAAQTRA
ncbi:MAG: branched-chain amino acid ABC transporter permease [Chloroflexi bacterium]|nr:branched-chain amino acid ABC transporter permease [Chloroflexota bacterium]MDL1882821.1 branched-chain amino acid ABC transporter permease [Anaerolineae bacterium CFX8]GIL12492.1 MAG: branched-chain amino acid ABC transporter permease [Chloroflexota bacterium]